MTYCVHISLISSCSRNRCKLFVIIMYLLLISHLALHTHSKSNAPKPFVSYGTSGSIQSMEYRAVGCSRWGIGCSRLLPASAFFLLPLVFVVERSSTHGAALQQQPGRSRRRLALASTQSLPQRRVPQAGGETDRGGSLP